VCIAVLVLHFSIQVPPASAQRSTEGSLSTIKPLPRTKMPRIRWGKDPFKPLIPRTIEFELKLSAVIYNRQRPSAIIDDKIVYIRDYIDGFKVIDIGKNYVILSGERGKLRLDLQKP
jgi:hypothetical protein